MTPQDEGGFTAGKKWGREATSVSQVEFAREGDMEQETITPGRGSPESAAWFRAQLAEIGIGQSALARLLLHNGDDRKFDTILRGLRRMASGEARVSGEMRAAFALLQALTRMDSLMTSLVEGELRAFRDQGVGLADDPARPLERVSSAIGNIQAEIKAVLRTVPGP